MLIIIDAGHGGCLNGVYQTAGKRAYHASLPSGSLHGNALGVPVYYEGVGNRVFSFGLGSELQRLGFSVFFTVTDSTDLNLYTRVALVKSLAKKQKCLFVSIHSDASENPLARGHAVWTAPGHNESDDLADMLNRRALPVLLEHRTTFRQDTSDGDSDYEANFAVLRGAGLVCPSVLIENLFFTNIADVQLLVSRDYFSAITIAWAAAIKEYTNG